MSKSLLDNAIAITDKKQPNYYIIDHQWLRSNPKGYTEWFKYRMKIQHDLGKKAFAESIKCDVEEVPDYKIKTPLQRSIQILKRHRDVLFNKDDQK